MEEVKPDPRLRPLWDAILEVYKVFAAICDKHGLRYCADTGTTLGAIRHKGFIPWDDDMDMQMPRPDYDKLVEVVKKELPEGFAWVDRFNCPGFEYPFGKIVVSNENKIREVEQKCGQSLGDGIFIDIFPLDGFPDSYLGRMRRKVQEVFINCSNRFYSGIELCETLKSKIAWLIGLILFSYRIKTMKDRSDYYEKRARRYGFGKTKLCVSIGLAAAWDDKPYPVEYFGTPQLVPFDSTKVPIQEKATEYLSIMFGEYMKLPPKCDRHSTHDHSKIAPWRVNNVASSAE